MFFLIIISFLCLIKIRSKYSRKKLFFSVLLYIFTTYFHIQFFVGLMVWGNINALLFTIKSQYWKKKTIKSMKNWNKKNILYSFIAPKSNRMITEYCDCFFLIQLNFIHSVEIFHRNRINEKQWDIFVAEKKVLFSEKKYFRETKN